MAIERIMSAPVVTAEPSSSLEDVVGTLLTNRIGSVVVVDPGVVGILTRSDILRAAYDTGVELTELTATDAMSTDVVTVEESTSVDEALQRMERHSIKKLPVVDGIELVGIVTMTDIARNQPKRVREIRRTMTRKDDWTD